MTKNEILKLADNTETPQIRAGETHRFNDIWIVVTDGRLFCRQYSHGKKSWYHAFLSNPKGAIKCGNTVVEIKGVVPDDLDSINSSVNAAYIEKYEKRLNHYPDIAHLMTGERFMKTTMELIPVPAE